MHVGRNETAIAYHNHLSSAAFSIAAEAMRLIDMQERKDGSGIDKGPEFVRKNSERDDGHSIPLVQGIGEGHKRHIMSSSRGTRGTEGIFPGAIARAVSSTSLPEFPTAASVLFTTATYLPAYLVTSSLQCSTIQRSSLAIAAPPMAYKSIGLTLRLWTRGRQSRRHQGIHQLILLYLVVFSLLTGLSRTPASAASPLPYAVTGQCDGLPRLNLTTPPGFCVGLVAHGLNFPRGLVPLPNGDLLVADMGGWKQHVGALWLLHKEPAGQGYSRSKLFAELDRPHGMALGPDGLPYVGIPSGVFRFDPYAPSPEASRVDVIGGTSGVPGFADSGRHPLIPLLFDTHGVLFVGIGSASDNCENSDKTLPPPDKPCAEAEGEQARGAIRQYVLSWPEGKVVRWSTYAFGLRNSLAMAVHPYSNRLLQGENARDAMHRRLGLPDDEEFPHDELNLIEAGRHYGWPYCYDAGKASPEFPHTDCRHYQSPLLLLPPHAAPLGMTYYFGAMFPKSFTGALLIGYHGYRKYGHRLMAFPTDANGMPSGQAPSELISNWQEPLGAPVDIKVAPDGAVVLSEDRNKTVLRLFFAPPLSRQ